MSYINGNDIVIKADIEVDTHITGEWNAIADITLEEDTNEIVIDKDLKGNNFALDKLMITAGLKVTKTPAPYMVKLNDCNIMQVKTCDNLNKDVNRYMSISAETFGNACMCSANVASIASSLGCAGEEGENLMRYGFSKYNFGNGINKIGLKNFVNNTQGVPTIATNIEGNKTYSYRRLTDLADGVRIEFDSASGYLPYRYTENVGGISEGGLKLKFRNYENKTSDASLNGYGQVVIILSGFGGTPSAPSDATTKIKKYVPYLQLDTVNGALYLASCNDISFGSVDGFTTHQTIIKSDALKNNNIAGKEFDITIKDNDKTGCVINRDYEVVVTVNGSDVASGILHSELLNALQYHPKTDSCYVSIGGLDNDGNNRNAWAVEFLGFENQEYGKFSKGSTITVWGRNN